EGSAQTGLKHQRDDRDVAQPMRTAVGPIPDTVRVLPEDDDLFRRVEVHFRGLAALGRLDDRQGRREGSLPRVVEAGRRERVTEGDYDVRLASLFVAERHEDERQGMDQRRYLSGRRLDIEGV